MDPFRLIQKRLNEIAASENHLRVELDRLSAERLELGMAEKLLCRLHDRFKDEPVDAPEVTAEEVEKEARSADGPAIPKDGAPRPEGIPTLAEMIDEVLADFEKMGRVGLSGRDLVTQIGLRYWPGVGWNSVLPTALRLVKKGRFARDGQLYKRVPTPSLGAMFDTDEMPGLADHLEAVGEMATQRNEAADHRSAAPISQPLDPFAAGRQADPLEPGQAVEHDNMS